MGATVDRTRVCEYAYPGSSTLSGCGGAGVHRLIFLIGIRSVFGQSCREKGVSTVYSLDSMPSLKMLYLGMHYEIRGCYVLRFSFEDPPNS